MAKFTQKAALHQFSDMLLFLEDGFDRVQKQKVELSELCPNMDTYIGALNTAQKALLREYEKLQGLLAQLPEPIGGIQLLLDVRDRLYITYEHADRALRASGMSRGLESSLGRPETTDPALADRILRQSKGLVRAVEALGTIEPTNRLERKLVGLLLYLYKRRLRAIVKAVPTWVSKEILSASERIEDRQPALWTSEN